MTGRTATILVVDDHSTNRLKMSMAVKRLGYETCQAEDGREALSRLRRDPVDLVLLDIVMPEMDGYEVLAAIKEDPGLRDIPIIVISALDELDSVVKAIELGAEDYLPKAFDPVLLKARIGACLEKKQLRDLEVEYLRQVELPDRRGGHHRGGRLRSRCPSAGAASPRATTPWAGSPGC